jgi:hypothetical protein
MQEWIGAYVLDALEPDETEQVGLHIAGCTECQDEVVELAWIPPLLRTVSLEDIERLDAGTAAHPSRVLDGLLARATRERRRTHRTALAAVAAVLVAALTAVGIASSGGSGDPGVIAVQTVDPRSHLHVAVTMGSHSWGTALDLHLSGVAPGERCSLVVHGRDGQRDVAATWTASYRGTADVPATTPIQTSQITELDVVTASGTRLAQLAVPSNPQ